MGKMKIKYRVADAALVEPGDVVPDAVGADTAGKAVGGPEVLRHVGQCDLLQAGLDKARALLRLYVHSRKVRAAAKELAEALAESREVSSWPGDRLPVGAAMSEQVERLTRRLKLETEAHNRLEALFRTVDLGRSAAAV